MYFCMVLTQRGKANPLPLPPPNTPANVRYSQFFPMYCNIPHKGSIQYEGDGGFKIRGGDFELTGCFF